MCFPERSRLCIVCMIFYLLSWTPAENHSTTDHGNQSNIYQPMKVKNHSHSHDVHDDHQIPMATLDKIEGYDRERGEEEQNYFLRVLFDKYSTNGSLKVDALFLMLDNLGLRQETQNKTAQGHEDHDHDLFDEKHDHGPDHDHHEGHEHDYTEKDHDKGMSNIIQGFQDHVRHSMCVSNPLDLLSIYHYNLTKGLVPPMLLNICPALLTMIDKSLCQSKSLSQSNLDNKPLDDHDHDHDNHSEDNETSKRIEGEIWGYSCISVVIISLVGLLGVAVIPVMQKVFYNHLLQFLVALAVGALSGDALLHLIPHAFGGGSHSHHDHRDKETGDSTDGVLKGLCGLGGIYIFFTMERLLTIYTESKKRKKRKSRLGRRTMEEVAAVSKLNSPEGDHDCESAMLGIHFGARALDNYAKESEKHLNTLREEESCDLNNHGSGNESEEAEGVLHSHHGHSHHHHKKVPTTVASIAWMVVLGDGIHNLSDGLAIGAAFANSITGGISTSIAIFCHELPHEIGDFAVLLRAGMSVKQAIVYNCVSSVLAFIGMVIGVLIGNVGSASLWIFAMIGGIFLYIALVDMMPEMTALDTKKGENLFCHLMLQSCGMVLGAGIMFLIAIFEHDLMTFLEP